MTSEDRWECGSDLRWLPIASESSAPRHAWGDDATLCGSGRVAFKLLLDHARRERAWKRLWLPSYFCQEVVGALAACKLPLVSYPDHPDLPVPPLDQLPLRRGDAVLVVNYFGLRKKPEGPRLEEIDVIEDHSHDPWSPWALNSSAEFCVVSLRKTLPVPDGGVLWSPRGLPIPSLTEVTAAHAEASGQVLAARVLKQLYSLGAPVEKTRFRELFLNAEKRIATGPSSAMWSFTRVVLGCFPIEAWRQARRRNANRLQARVASLPHVTTFAPHFDGACPVKVMLRLDSRQRRDSLRARLSANRVYTAILWSLDDPHVDVDPNALELSNRILGFSCEADYDVADMDHVADIIQRVMPTG